MHRNPPLVHSEDQIALNFGHFLHTGFQRIAGVAATATVASQLFSAHPAFAARKKDEKAPMVDESFNAFASVYTPMLQNGGVSMVFGLAAGGALKFVGRAALVAVGIVFALMQLGAHYGFVTVNWTNLEKSVNKLMDLVSI